MEDASPSPRIESISWGSLQVDGADERSAASYKDAKLFPGGSREWDWTETGTSHDPGVQPDDVAELLEKGADVVVLSRGMNERLKVQERTLRLLRERGIDVHVAQTRDAARLYNEHQARGEAVGGLFHTTC